MRNIIKGVLLSLFLMSVLVGCASGGIASEEKNLNITVYSSSGVELYSYTGRAKVIDEGSGLIKFKDKDDREHTVHFDGGSCIINEVDDSEGNDTKSDSSQIEE